MVKRTTVYLETGKHWTFASAIDWPGWSRRGRGEDEALAALADYADRYSRAVGQPMAIEFDVVGHVSGNRTTDFGAPDGIGDWDREPVSPNQAQRLAELLDRIWQAFDAAVEASSPTLIKGPRGGGRDRDKIVDHVREAERSYARKIDVSCPPRTPWPEQRTEILATVRAGVSDQRWPLPYLVRRAAWHVLDHAWEIEDKQP